MGSLSQWGEDLRGQGADWLLETSIPLVWTLERNPSTRVRLFFLSLSSCDTAF